MTMPNPNTEKLSKMTFELPLSLPHPSDQYRQERMN